MKNAAFIFSILIFAIAISFSSYCEEIAVREWSPYSGVEGLSSADNVLTLRSTSSMPLLATKGNIFINASRLKFVDIKMRSDKSYMTGRMFFRRIGDPGFNYYNSFEFQTGINNMYHSNIIALNRNPNWFGTVTQIMLSPINGEGSVKIESVDFLEPGILIAARAYWQEFFTLEVPQMRTVNFIYGQKINGTSIYLYIYCLILLISIFVISAEYVKHKDLNVIYRSASMKILTICVIFWAVLDLRVLFDQARTVMLDSQTYSGKSLEEKRALATLGDIYGFLSFSGSKIPKGSGFNTVNPPYYYFREKAVYYLYPRRVDENAAYVLVYNTDRSQDKTISEYIKKGYKTFSTFKEGEFILKK